jgi:hypothetical protein
MVNQITKMRLPDGTEVAFVDWEDQSIYSSAYAQTGFTDSQILLFTYAAGETVSVSQNITTSFTATERETNVATAGQLNQTEEMLVYAIKPEISIYGEDVLGAIDALNVTAQPGLPLPSMPQLRILDDSLVLRLWVSQKVMNEEKLGYYNTGFGAMGMGAMFPAATGVQRTYGSRGLPSQDAVRSLAMPVYIGGGETYYVSLDNFAGAAVDFGVLEGDVPTFFDRLVAKIAIHLDGLHKRPVS